MERGSIAIGIFGTEITDGALVARHHLAEYNSRTPDGMGVMKQWESRDLAIELKIAS